MAELLFKLRNVPSDEADEVRKLLRDHGIDFYETEAGNWGISLPAIWLHSEGQLDEARSLINAYQQQRRKNARQTYEHLRQRGEQRTVMDKVREAPLLAAIYLGAALLILYLSIMPFLGMFR